MDKKKAQDFLKNNDFEEFMKKDKVIEEEKEPDDFEATNIIAGFPCREVFEVQDDGSIIKRVEFEALQEGSKENLPEWAKEKLKKLQDDKAEVWKIDKTQSKNIESRIAYKEKIIDTPEEIQEKNNQEIDITNTKAKTSQLNSQDATKYELADVPDTIRDIEPKSEDKFDDEKLRNYVEGVLIEALKTASPIYKDVLDNIEKFNVVKLNSNEILTKDDSKASSSNKVYKRKSDYVDKMYDEMDEEYLKRAELREIGIPIDENFEKDKTINSTLKFISSCATIGGLWAMYFGASPALTLAGITGYVGCTYIANKMDLKYRTAVYLLQNTYLNSRGGLTKDDVKDIMMVTDYKAPDKYSLACMTEEERQIALADTPSKLSKKQMIKRIYNALNEYERKENLRILKMKEKGKEGIEM